MKNFILQLRKLLGSLIEDETYKRIWRWVVEKTQGYRVVLVFLLTVIIGYLVVVITRIVISVPQWPVWTGFGTRDAWDLADLLLVPSVLAVVALLFNITQKRREEKIERWNTEEETLRNYFDKMTELLLEPNNLRESEEESEVRIVARVRTLAALRNLNQERRGSVLRFLMEAELVSGEPKVSLAEAVLENVNLEHTNLQGANLRKAKLQGAKLLLADLREADLLSADLREANLVFTNLQGAALSLADLRSANLLSADLKGALLGHADLRGADLGSTNLEEVDLERAKLTDANLIGAKLRDAKLREANLEGAKLLLADLREADLRKANLSGVRLWNAKLEGAKYDKDTVWPEGFDPQEAGAILIERDEEEEEYIPVEESE